MIRKSNDIYAAIALMSGSSHDKSRLQERVRKYQTECGCGMSGMFLIVAFLASVLHLMCADSFSWRSAAAGVVLIVGAAFVGKILGIAWARARLLLLRRSLARQLAAK
jgi:hypothetical protein